jgi:hypothetical protein
MELRGQMYPRGNSHQYPFHKTGGPGIVNYGLARTTFNDVTDTEKLGADFTVTAFHLHFLQEKATSDTQRT